MQRVHELSGNLVTLLLLQWKLLLYQQDLDNETLLHIDAENRRQTLEEDLEFLKTLHDQACLDHLIIYN